MRCERADGMNKSIIDLFHPVYLPETEAVALEVLRSAQITNGPKVEELEHAFSTIVGRKNIVSTNNLTSAIFLALRLAGVRSGDEVATIAFSCLQSNSPIAQLGASPIWIDIVPATMSMSLEDLAAKLKPSVKAVMVYHVAGYPSDTRSIASLCQERGIPLIEDCNNAIGATINGLPVGIFGEYAVYSFYPNRQINGIEGGMLATPNLEIAAHAARLRRFGIDLPSFRDSRGEINPCTDVPEIGWSSALSNLNAAVALSQLSTLNDRKVLTEASAQRLANGLSGLRRLRVVQPIPGGTSAFWGFLVLSEDRDALMAYLRVHGIKSSTLHHRNDWYTGFNTLPANLPGTELVMSQLLALPCGYWLTNSQINQLICKVRKFDDL